MYKRQQLEYSQEEILFKLYISTENLAFIGDEIPHRINWATFQNVDYLPIQNSINNIPGTSCGSGKVYDCAGNCVDQNTAQNWIGDGYCDDGTYGMVLTCSAFNNDGGDCDVSNGNNNNAGDYNGGSSSNSPGNSCGNGMVYDCVGNCVSQTTAQSWIGDGYCDDGTYGMVLTCSAFNNDGGDCN